MELLTIEAAELKDVKALEPATLEGSIIALLLEPAALDD